jgi:hypothetical protein
MQPQDLGRLRYDGRSVFFDIANEYPFLKPQDLILLESSGSKEETPAFAAVTHRFERPVSEFDEQHPLLWGLKHRLGRESDAAEIMRVLELKLVYEFEIDRPET